MILKLWKLVLVLLALGVVGFPLASCASKTNSTTSQSQTATVKRGDLETVISVIGYLAFSTRNDLVFHISGTAAQVNVKVGDNVTKGQVLTTLDTTDLEQAVTTADLAVKSSQIDLQVAQQGQSKIKDQEMAVQSAQIDLQVAQKAQVNSVTSAQLDLQTKTDSLAQLTYPYTYATFTFDVPAAIDAINNARLQLDLASAGLQAGPGSPDYGTALDKFRQAQDSLKTAQERLLKGQNAQSFAESTAGTYQVSPGVTSTTQAMGNVWTVAAAQIAVEKAQLALDNTTTTVKTSLDKATIALTKAQSTLEDTKNSVKTSLDKATVNLDTANNNLRKAKDNLAKAVIPAPYDGIVTAVNISGGQQVNSGQIAISVADPTKLEADVLVNEMDIYFVNNGSTANLQIQVGAAAVEQPAKVTKVSPTATVSSGVVSYTVTIELPSTSISTAQSGQTTSAQPGQTRTPAQQGRTAGAARGAGPNAPASIQLRQGLSVTANIVKEQRRNVLLVPSRAITQQGGNSTVQVSRDGILEQRIVTIGLTDGQNTEITQGLSEGELIIIPARTTTTTTAPAGGGAAPFRIGGIGR